MVNCVVDHVLDEIRPVKVGGSSDHTWCIAAHQKAPRERGVCSLGGVKRLEEDCVRWRATALDGRLGKTHLEIGAECLDRQP